MPRGTPTTIDEYLAAVSGDRRAALEALRATIRSIIPRAEECISYQLPAFRLDGMVVAGFAATRTGCSYYPFSGSTLSALAEEVAGYEQTKGALHFGPAKPLPPALVRKLIETRGAERQGRPGDGKRRGPSPAIDRLRRICAALPGAVEKPSHGAPTWFAGAKGKVFAMLDDHHHGAARVSVYLPAPDGLQETLIASEPERYWVPPYVGHRGWVGVFLDGDVDWEMVEKLVAEGYLLVAPRRPAGQPAQSAPGSGRRRR